VNGEKYKIKAKYDIDNLNIDKINLESMHLNEPINLSLKAELPSKYKDIVSRSTIKEEDKLQLKNEDYDKYHNIVKKYKLK